MALKGAIAFTIILILSALCEAIIGDDNQVFYIKPLGKFNDADVNFYPDVSKNNEFLAWSGTKEKFKGITLYNGTKCVSGSYFKKPIPEDPTKWLTNRNTYLDPCMFSVVPQHPSDKTTTDTKIKFRVKSRSSGGSLTINIENKDLIIDPELIDPYDNKYVANNIWEFYRIVPTIGDTIERVLMDVDFTKDRQVYSVDGDDLAFKEILVIPPGPPGTRWDFNTRPPRKEEKIGNLKVKSAFEPNIGVKKYKGPIFVHQLKAGDQLQNGDIMIPHFLRDGYRTGIKYCPTTDITKALFAEYNPKHNVKVIYPGCQEVSFRVIMTFEPQVSKDLYEEEEEQVAQEEKEASSNTKPNSLTPSNKLNSIKKELFDNKDLNIFFRGKNPRVKKCKTRTSNKLIDLEDLVKNINAIPKFQEPESHLPRKQMKTTSNTNLPMDSPLNQGPQISRQALQLLTKSPPDESPVSTPGRATPLQNFVDYMQTDESIKWHYCPVGPFGVSPGPGGVPDLDITKFLSLEADKSSGHDSNDPFEEIRPRKMSSDDDI